MNNNKGSVVLSVILTVLVVGLVGYIIYDKVSSPKNPGSLNTGVKENENKEVTDNNEVTKCPDCDCQSTVEEPKSSDCNCPTCNNVKNINENQSVKIYYYASNFGKTAYHNGRVSLTLYQSGDNYGFFTIDSSFGNEIGNHANGAYKIADGKLILSNISGDGVYAFEKELGVTLVADSERNDMKSYSLDYNVNELQIGDIKLYSVNS